jgi:thiosulfate reductase/polysulfide reductase chain A
VRKTGVVLGDKVPTCEEEGLALSFDIERGKIELYSKTLVSIGSDPIPEFTPHQEPPPGQFRLLFGRTPVHTFGRTTNNRFLSLITSENEVWVNAEVAKEVPGVGPVKSGDEVVLINQDGVRSLPIRVKVTQRIRGDCVYMVHGYGHTAKGLKFARRRGAADSELITKYEVDPIMGGTGMNVNFVCLERAAAKDLEGAA